MVIFSDPAKMFSCLLETMMSITDLTVRMSYWYKLEESAAGWWVEPCVCMSGPVVPSDPIFIRLDQHFGPYLSRAQAVQMGDKLIEQLGREEG